jgi:hypothetical protein
MMFNLNESDSRLILHFDRVARIDRDGWKAVAPARSRPNIGWARELIARAHRLSVSTRNFARPVAARAERKYL